VKVFSSLLLSPPALPPPPANQFPVGDILRALTGGGGGGGDNGGGRIGGGGGGGAFFSAFRGQFDEQYRCFSFAVLGRAELEGSDKIVLPPSALERLTMLEVSYPMLFRISGIEPTSAATHCGVIEFSGDEGRCYLPHWVMTNLAMEEGAFISVRSAQLPKGRFVKFRPASTDFIRLSNPKAVLEKHLSRFSCLTKGDSICVHYAGKNYFIDVLELQPAVSVDLRRSDVPSDALLTRPTPPPPQYYPTSGRRLNHRNRY
jgi:ubiquitin fusion degradation protein 1